MTQTTLKMKFRPLLCPLLILVSFLIIPGCKKTEEQKKDLLQSFNNTVWTGYFNYPGKDPEPVSIGFQEDRSFTWLEVLGEFRGTWKLDSNDLVVSFSSGAGFRAGVSAGNTLTNIRNNAINNWAMQSATLNTTPDDTVDSTNWDANSTYDDILFSMGNKIRLTKPGGSSEDFKYQTKLKTFKFDNGKFYFFFVRTDKTHIDGSYWDRDKDAKSMFKMTKR